jgi:transcriptional regulator with XRE-family HTH domain
MTVPLAERLRACRKRSGLTLDGLAERAAISKTYLWELEADEAGVKRPSLDIVRRLADALGSTLDDLLDLPSVSVDGTTLQMPPSLVAFRERMATLGEPLANADLADLMRMRFRHARPEHADDWHALYLLAQRWT